MAEWSQFDYVGNDLFFTAVKLTIATTLMSGNANKFANRKGHNPNAEKGAPIHTSMITFSDC